MSERKRKTGSVVLTIMIGIALIALAMGIYFGDLDIRKYPKVVDVGTCLIFGGILFWWACSENKSWGIGFETITMTVTVVLAVVAIPTLAAN